MQLAVFKVLELVFLELLVDLDLVLDFLLVLEPLEPLRRERTLMRYLYVTDAESSKFTVLLTFWRLTL